MEPDQKDKLVHSIKELVEKNTTVHLGTMSQEGLPHASYAPFVRTDDGVIYVHISELAQHCENIKTNRRVSALIIEDEALAKNVFARKRITYEGFADEVDKSSQEWSQAMDLFGKRFGEFFTQGLRDMADFHTFRLTFDTGTLVLGFGKAYRLQGKSLSDIRWLQGVHGKVGTGVAKVEP